MGDFSEDLLTIAKVFAAAIAGFLVLATFFGLGEFNTILNALMLLLNICLSTLIAVGVMILLITLSGRFFRLF